MKEIQYKTFSLRTHKKNWQIKRPNVCQWELTFSCDLHCGHCYTDCYYRPSFIKKELNTKQIKYILDKVYDLGVVWLCFTGGDPLKRKDFLEIYSYAKDKGFIITIFTTGFSMTKEIADYLEKRPPFVIEITINSVTKETYEKVTQVKGSYERVMSGLNLIVKKKLPLKVKTMATKQNLEELALIKEFLEERKIKFRPSALLHARLNGDNTPCNLRLQPKEISNIDRLFGVESTKEDDEGAEVYNVHKRKVPTNNRIFHCAFGGGDGINLDPYGNMFPCNCIRKPAINFLDSDLQKIKKTIFETFREISNLEFNSNSKCRSCGFVDLCLRCPGKALLETGDIEAPIEYFCELAHYRR
jgi:radical SAM protein with 4Fe4S-binding SPASM domain